MHVGDGDCEANNGAVRAATNAAEEDDAHSRHTGNECGAEDDDDDYADEDDEK